MTAIHRIHAAPVASRVQFHELGHAWRADGGRSLPEKVAVAYRLALCWNVMEGIPTELIEAGWIRDLCAAVDAGDLAKAQAIVRQWSERIELVDGRPHDCKQCIGEQALEADAP